MRSCTGALRTPISRRTCWISRPRPARDLPFRCCPEQAAEATMLGSIKLSLRMGVVPVPAPDFVIEALSSVKVDLGSGSTQSGFELTFDVPLNSKIYGLFMGVGA